MRTIKALACATALVAGVATSMAQSNVYSLNVVGYYNVPVAAGTYVMVANQLNTTNNNLSSLIPQPPPSSYFYKFAGGNWSAYFFDPDDLVWTPDGAATLNLGEAGMFRAPIATTLTFVGEVQQGTLTNPLLNNGQLMARSSMVPQAGLITSVLGYPAEGSDYIYQYGAGNWSAFFFDPDDLLWTPSQPTFAVGEGFMATKVGPGTAWTRNFTVQ